MNRADRIATAKRVASSDSLPAKKEPAPTHGVMQQDNEENSFIKRISKWSNRDRSNWTNDKRPSHRNLTIGAALSQGALQTKNDSDMSALKGLEDSLQAMDTYVRKGNQDEHTHAADVTETMSNVKDLLRIREQSKQRARDTVANHAHEHRPKGPMFQVDETPDSPGMYRPIKPFDPDNLESVRRHQQFLDRKDEERRQAERSEREMHNFHALPMPGHVPFSDPAAAVEALPRDSLGDLIGEPEPPCSRKEKKKTPSCQSAAPKDLKAFFLTEGDTAAHEASSGEESSGEESNDDDIDAELAELVQKEREIMRSYTRLSRQRDRAMQAAAALTSEPSVDSYTTPRGASAGNRPASRLLTPGSTPRPTSTDVLLREATGGSGPSILDLDQKEREVLFKLKKEQKIRELKRETELQTVRDVQRAPNIAQAQESWRRAKEEHNRETLRQMQHEEMKQKLADMQEEMRIMRLEQKVNELRKVSENKILKDKLRGLVRAGMAETSVGESPAKAKKKKRKRTASKDKPKHNGIEFAGDPSVFTAGTAAGPESSLAEESSLLGLMTNSMVQGSSGFDGLSSQGKDAPKRSNRNRLPPRGPSLSYSQFDARGSILEEEEEGPRPEFSAAVRADRSALDLLSEEPSYVEDKSKVPARQSFESRGGGNIHAYLARSNHHCEWTGRRPRDQPPAISFSEQHVTAPHQVMNPHWRSLI